MRSFPLCLSLLALMAISVAACNPAPPDDGTSTASSSMTSSDAGAKEGEFCGGIAALPCARGLMCKLEGTFPDAGGTCVQESLSILDPSRVTKKPFGIRIDPATSPVSPERFRGWHTGADFEALPDEDEEDIAVPAICDGPVVAARWVGGYGGMLVQRCVIAGEDVTVLYGHLDLSTLASGEMKAGDTIGKLGKGYSAETDNERPHLHLAVHKGKAVELKGYVQTESALSGWVDPLTVLR